MDNEINNEISKEVSNEEVQPISLDQIRKNKQVADVAKKVSSVQSFDFESQAKLNEANKRRMEEERKKANKKVIRSHNLIK